MLREGTGLAFEEAFGRATVAAVRTLSGRPDVRVEFGDGGGDAIALPAFSLSEDDIARVRGAADSAALRLRHHDARIHSCYRPPTRKAADAYEALEQARVEILGATRYRGVAANIARALLLRGSSVPELQMALHWRAGTIPGRQVPPPLDRLLDQLLAHIGDQDAFSGIARRVIEVLLLDRVDDEEAQTAARAVHDSTSPEGIRRVATEVEAPGGKGRPVLGGATRGEGTGLVPAAPVPAASKQYRVYTSRYDQVLQARDLCPIEEAARLRTVLDVELNDFQPVVNRLVNRLQRRLTTRRRWAWEHNLEEGLLDASRVARIVTSRGRSLAFKQAHASRFRDSAVCVLFDNSGSMQGRPITVAAMTAETLARTLERCGVTVEVLGFTTVTWKGGESRRHWESAGRPQGPGRLNDLRHIVYKPASTPWKHARLYLGAMISPSILRENIDGEALVWAFRRLCRRHEQRKILVVVSDGAPADESTLSANGSDYLERHLREIAARIERHSDVELVAIGLGHDVKRYYRKAVTISDSEELARLMLREMTVLFETDAR